MKLQSFFPTTLKTATSKTTLTTITTTTTMTRWLRSHLWLLAPILWSQTAPAWSQTPGSAPASFPSLQVTVTQDGDTVSADAGITLREAILLVNGDLALEALSASERSQVTPLNANAASQIGFDLPAGQTTIQLQSLLPPLASPGLLVDGSTQPGYDPELSATAEIAIPIPLVSITPAAGQEVFRGLTIVADGVTVRGLSLYGFTSFHDRTASTPPADIFIAHPAPPPDISQQQPPAQSFAFINERDMPPQAITLENNWLGIPPDQSFPSTPSAFGVSVFNSLGATVRRNYIANHDGSGIISGVRAENLQVIENLIIGNGLAGMPDGIRLEGVISNSLIQGNRVCGNDGSGVYLFKPEGAVTIQDNDIIYNGRRLRRSAIYLMGNEHQVFNNRIRYQTGSGVTVAAYPSSIGNDIQQNQFFGNEGLSIDLITFNATSVQAYAWGDGPNPPRNSANRRQDTGNAAVDAPEFLNLDDLVFTDTVTLQGKAAPGADVGIYRVANVFDPPAHRFPGYGDLAELIATVSVGDDGNFVFTGDLEPGDSISAIATDPQYGTSEPSPIVFLGDPGEPTPLPPEIPQCVTAPVPEPEPEPEPVPEPLVLSVPRNIHFALDQATISPESADVLDQIAAVLQEYPFITVELLGHTDPRASYAYNLDLSNRRAMAARNYLIRQGIAPERMTIRALSESQRATTGDTRLDYARDRRVEFIFRDLRGLDIVFESQESDLQIEGR